MYVKPPNLPRQVGQATAPAVTESYWTNRLKSPWFYVPVGVVTLGAFVAGAGLLNTRRASNNSVFTGLTDAMVAGTVALLPALLLSAGAELVSRVA